MKSDSKHHYEEKTNKDWLIHDRLIYVAILTPGHDQSDQNSEISDASVIRTFHQRVSGISLWNRMRSSITPVRLGVDPLLLHNESRQLRWSGDLTRMLPGWGVSGMPSPEADPRHSGKIPSFGYFRNILVSLDKLARTKEVWVSAYTADSDSDKQWMDGWKQVYS